MPFLMDAFEPKKDSAHIRSYLSLSAVDQIARHPDTSTCTPHIQSQDIHGERLLVASVQRLDLYPSTTSRVPPRPHYPNPFRSAALWDSSEVKIVRVAPLLTKVAREAMVLHTGLRLRPWMITTRSSKAALNGCTEVFTLKHEQQDGGLAQEDSRDAIALAVLW